MRLLCRDHWVGADVWSEAPPAGLYSDSPAPDFKLTTRAEMMRLYHDTCAPIRFVWRFCELLVTCIFLFPPEEKQKIRNALVGTRFREALTFIWAAQKRGARWEARLRWKCRNPANCSSNQVSCMCDQSRFFIWDVPPSRDIQFVFNSMILTQIGSCYDSDIVIVDNKWLQW